MWLFTSLGFFSAVAHRDDPETIILRARVRADLEALREATGEDFTIHDTPEADYGYRAFLGRAVFAQIAAKLAGDIDYPNFKNTVQERQGYARAHTYLDIWQTMLHLQYEN